MAKRFTGLRTRSDRTLVRLEYEEQYHRLLALLARAEDKLQSWSVKLGTQAEVEALLTDYMVRDGEYNLGDL